MVIRGHLHKSLSASRPSRVQFFHHASREHAAEGERGTEGTVWVAIWMQAQGRLTPGSLDVVLRRLGAFLDAQQLIVRRGIRELSHVAQLVVPYSLKKKIDLKLI